MAFETLKNLLFHSELETRLLQSSGDSPLIQKHSTVRSFHVKPGFTFNLRVFVLQHYKAHKLPAIPCVLFVHGLGGQLNQFEYLIDYFSHFATVLSVDLPGHGKSEYVPDYKAYSQETLLGTLEAVIQGSVPDQEIVLIGHSMGSVLSVKLAERLGSRCVGVIALCPPAVVDPKFEGIRGALPYMPAVVMDLFRAGDRVGGLKSHSVSRMVGRDPQNPGEAQWSEEEQEVRKKQLRYNLQVNTRAWMRTAYNFVPASNEEWTSLGCPLYLVGAAEDEVLPPDMHISQILEWFAGASKHQRSCDVVESTIIPVCGHAVIIEKPQILCGLVGDFIFQHVDKKLSLGWQLAFMASKMDKWSLKNEAKWRQVQSVGDRIPGTPFRGMKTLRQEDQSHSPVIFEQKYPDVTDVIDISRETPPYEPLTFKRIKYHKFPTVSKIPPTEKEVKEFITLVDKCLDEAEVEDPVVAIHCHYGFNRTGFFICSYMIEHLHFRVKDALAAFKNARSPGIKHPHFIDELYVRYELGAPAS
ncbi:hypothetical protein TRVA0_047S00958 [Trichomonascus vanleenenianus]|uniref:triacylglycerol lipase n=1 Tax=Trichomonascus vanleenenianus TaxID=2268995 RepID=UPI003EC998E8